MAKPAPWLPPAVWTGGAVPLVLLVWDASSGRLGANPVATALNQLGLLALVSLVASLACTPLQLLFKWTWPARVRRALGVWAFFFATTHLLLYVVVDQGLVLKTLWEDVLKRPFITVGFAAWCLMLPLALTSTPGGVRRLGFVTWKRLHRLAYVIAGLGLLHFTLRVKKDLTEPLVYVAVVGVLMLLRLSEVAKQRAKARAKERARAG